MWFKTRIGLVAVSELIEMRAFHFPESGTWGIAAQLRNGPDAKGGSVFGKMELSGPWFYLAMFKDRPGVERDIGTVFERIATAVRAKDPLCDLSDAGQPDAWKSELTQIAWPSDA